jgi:D-serine deaminase-like pyridoxal phosphate-dependent protein
MVSRRALLLGGTAAVAGAVAWKKPREAGGAHDAWFAALQQTLRANGIDRPVLVIDLDRLDRNIDRVVASAAAKPARRYRIVVKSLPAPGLVDYVARRAGTNAGMVFHRPFIEAMARLRPDSDLLLGKPMPLAALAHFYDNHTGAFDPARQLQWLVDTEARLAQYLELARARGLRLRINLELDVGLHRGGFAEPAALAGVLKSIADNPDALEFAGFMGYDAHMMGLPPALAKSELPRVKARYNACVAYLREQHRALAAQAGERLCLNGAGSPTFRHYEGDTTLNDVSVGTALMKPTHYDLPILADFEPSAFIATPVLKQLPTSGLPTLEWVGGLMRAWDPNTAQTWFVYGGNWMAEPESPPGLQRTGIYRSSNQEGWYGSKRVQLAVDDFLFLRPHQSEAVLLQFGDLVAVRGNTIEARWPVLQAGV